MQGKPREADEELQKLVRMHATFSSNPNSVSHWLSPGAFPPHWELCKEGVRRAAEDHMARLKLSFSLLQKQICLLHSILLSYLLLPFCLVAFIWHCTFLAEGVVNSQQWKIWSFVVLQWTLNSACLQAEMELVARGLSYLGVEERRELLIRYTAVGGSQTESIAREALGLQLTADDSYGQTI